MLAPSATETLDKRTLPSRSARPTTFIRCVGSDVELSQSDSCYEASDKDDVESAEESVRDMLSIPTSVLLGKRKRRGTSAGLDVEEEHNDKLPQKQVKRSPPKAVRVSGRQLVDSSDDDGSLRPYRCPYEGCGRAFKKSVKLVRHERSHTDECTEEGCTEAFVKHGQLRRHMCTHTGKDPYLCEVEGCDKGFKTSQKLKQHQQSVHNTTSRYICGHPLCTFQFPKWTLLVSHARTAHPPTCPTCNKTFTARSSLKSHMTTHDEQRAKVGCTWDGCEKEFLSEKARDVHVRTSHEMARAYRCDVEGCGKVFAHKHLEARHRRVHEKPPTPRPRRSDYIPAPTTTELITNDTSSYNARVGRTIPCPFEGCPSRFRRDVDLRKHVEYRHGREEDEEREVVERVLREMFGEVGEGIEKGGGQSGEDVMEGL
ncbi:Strongly-conserved Zn-finger binding protein (TFIIIA) [Rhizophlyctis rosea]|nr:Strongly-conserved Zn-finger binding protein (TFIIIA) [Rhizophlyctis rosea]